MLQEFTAEDGAKGDKQAKGGDETSKRLIQQRGKAEIGRYEKGT